MRKVILILGCIIGALALSFALLVTILSHTGNYVADPGFAYSYKKPSPDGKYLFVMLGPKIPRDQGEDNEYAREAFSLQSKFAHSGLYRNDGSSEPLWILNDNGDWQYSNEIFVSADGHHFAKAGFWPHTTNGEALTVFSDGQVVGKLSVGDLASVAWLLPGGVGHYQWQKKITFNDQAKTLLVETSHYDELVIDLVSGKIISSFRPLRVFIIVMSVITIGFTVLLLFRLRKGRMSI